MMMAFNFLCITRPATHAQVARSVPGTVSLCFLQAV